MEKKSSKDQFDAEMDELAEDMYMQGSGKNEISLSKIKLELEEGYKRLQVEIAEKLAPLKQLNINPSIVSKIESQIQSSAKKDFLQSMERFDISEINKVISDVAINAIKPIIPEEHDEENNLNRKNGANTIVDNANRYFEAMLSKETEKISTEKMSSQELKGYVENRLSKMGRKTSRNESIKSYAEQKELEKNREDELMDGITVPDNAPKEVKDAIEMAKRLSHTNGDISNMEKMQVVYEMYQIKLIIDSIPAEQAKPIRQVLVKLDKMLGYNVVKENKNGEVEFDVDFLRTLGKSIGMTDEEIEDMINKREFTSEPQNSNNKNNQQQEENYEQGNKKPKDQKQEALTAFISLEGEIYTDRMSQLAREDINAVIDVYNAFNQQEITGTTKEKIDELSEIIKREQEELLKKSFEGDMQTFQKEILGLVKINPDNAREFLKNIFDDRDISNQNIEQRAMLLQNAIKQAEEERLGDGQEQQVDPSEKLKDSFKKSDNEFQQEIGDIAKSDLESANRFLKDMFKDDPQGVQEYQNKILMLQEAIKQAEKEKLKEAFTKGDKEFKQDITEVVNDDPAVAQEFLRDFLKDENKTVGEYGGKIAFLQENINKALENRNNAKKANVLNADNVEISDLRGNTSLTQKEGQFLDDDGR